MFDFAFGELYLLFFHKKIWLNDDLTQRQLKLSLSLESSKK